MVRPQKEENERRQARLLERANARVGYRAASVTLATVIGAFGVSPAYATSIEVPAQSPNTLIEPHDDSPGSLSEALRSDVVPDAPLDALVVAYGNSALSAEGAASSAADDMADAEVNAASGPMKADDDERVPSQFASLPKDALEALAPDPSYDEALIVDPANVVTTLDSLRNATDVDVATINLVNAEANAMTMAARAANVTVSTEQELLNAIAAIGRDESATITLAGDIVLTRAISIDLPVYLTINMGNHTLTGAPSKSLFSVASSVDFVEASLFGGAASCLDTSSSSGLFSKSTSCNFIFEFSGGTFKSGPISSNFTNASVMITGSSAMATDDIIKVGNDALFQLNPGASLTSTAPGYAIEVASGGIFNMNGGSFTYEGTPSTASAIKCDKGGKFHIYNDASLDVEGVQAIYCESGSTLDFGKCYVVAHDGTIATGTVSGTKVMIDTGTSPEFSDASIKQWLDANGYALLTANDQMYHGVPKAEAERQSVGVLNGIYYTDQVYYDSIKPDPGPVDPDPGPVDPDPGPVDPDPGPVIPVGPVDPNPGPANDGSGSADKVGSGFTGNGNANEATTPIGSRGLRVPSSPFTPWNPPGLAASAGFTVPAVGPGVEVLEDLEKTPTAGAGGGRGNGESIGSVSLFDVDEMDTFAPTGVARVLALVGGVALTALLASRIASFSAANAEAASSLKRRKRKKAASAS